MGSSLRIKALIAVASCWRDTQNGYNEAVRCTWLDPGVHTSAIDATCLFFVGKPTTVEDKMRYRIDTSPLNHYERQLECPDDYKSLPEKTFAIIQFALDNGYDFLFKCDTDSYVNLDLMLGYYMGGEIPADYTGHFNGQPGRRNNVYSKCWAWASGGSGYWLSNAAMHKIPSPDGLAICPRLRYPCEDLWIGQVLGPYIEKGQLYARHDDRYGTTFTQHYCSQGMKRTFDPAWMYKQHADALAMRGNA